MFKKPSTDGAMHSAETILENTQRAANGALEDMTHALDQSMERAREAGAQLRSSAHRASLVTGNLIRHDPVKSVLIAAAAGAALMAIVNLLARPCGRY